MSKTYSVMSYLTYQDIQYQMFQTYPTMFDQISHNYQDMLYQKDQLLVEMSNLHRYVLPNVQNLPRHVNQVYQT